MNFYIKIVRKLEQMFTQIKILVDIFCIFAYNNIDRIRKASAAVAVCSNFAGLNLRGDVYYD